VADFDSELPKKTEWITDPEKLDERVVRYVMGFEEGGDGREDDVKYALEIQRDLDLGVVNYLWAAPISVCPRIASE